MPFQQNQWAWQTHIDGCHVELSHGRTIYPYRLNMSNVMKSRDPNWKTQATNNHWIQSIPEQMSITVTVHS